MKKRGAYTCIRKESGHSISTLIIKVSGYGISNCIIKESGISTCIIKESGYPVPRSLQVAIKALCVVVKLEVSPHKI